MLYSDPIDYVLGNSVSIFKLFKKYKINTYLMLQTFPNDVWLPPTGTTLFYYFLNLFLKINSKSKRDFISRNGRP